MKLNKQSGQALLVVVLVMVVALTVGLSLVTRSVVNLRTSTEDADSQKALAAAEAGIEQALQLNSSQTIGDPLKDSFGATVATYNTIITEVQGSEPLLLNGGNLVAQDDGADIWLVSHATDGTPNFSATGWSGDLTIYWGDASLNNECDHAAIEIAVISGTKASPSLKRYAYDPCGGSEDRKNDNKFKDTMSSGDYLVNGKKFKYKVELKGSNRISSGLVARVVPIYASTSMAIDGNRIALPTQGFTIDSTGTSGAGDREVKRSINHFRTFGQVPTQYFMYGLFSP